MSSDNLHTLNVKANEETAKVENWISTNKLPLNLSKTNFMLFSPKRNCRNNLTLTFYGKNIHRTSEAEYLRIYVDKNINGILTLITFAKEISQSCGLFAIFANA